ncbi:MAG: glycosyltransferase family 2 protein [Armatimonadota bacterium]|nr:glycosyltransferase family 2 protein [Armatimonadota bacterium]MDR7453002.1 glycosyltransferase family 2 protein [Armatimonadota bacterium]MDR7457559.1 glycosyltransferase family 2 protein [Armatimonadota bacterium]MDR7496337.1 glycosyltransferase family 2 protein [Armatimonadota bacterium]MDR7510543.1 glycosyltransferase family 2 protein [Armatimonadota bacterium]
MTQGPLLSVVIPVYNERATIEELLRRVAAAPFDKEIIVVDDGSTDGTREVLAGLDGTVPDGIRIALLPANAGKGAALRRGFQEARGAIVLVQDADLEYDPADYPRLLAPLLDGEADVVYGSRFLAGRARGRPGQRIGNRVLTLWSNLFTGLRLSDVYVCYKVFRREVLDGLALRENRFGFEAEVTARIARRGWRVREVPISYRPRTHAEGKKIKLKDALAGLWCVVRYGLFG